MRKGLIITIFIIPSIVRSQEIGYLNSFRGKIIRKNENQVVKVKRLFSDEDFIYDEIKNELQKGDKVYLNDKISTGLNSFAQIILKGKTTLVLGSNTYIKLTPEEINQETGLLHLIIPHGNPDKIKLETPHAAMGIRGTEFITQVNDQETLVALLSGELKITQGENDKILKAKHLLTISKNILNDELKIPDHEIFKLLKNSVKENPNLNQLDPYSNPPSIKKETIEIEIKKVSTKKSWQEILLENQSR